MLIGVAVAKRWLWQPLPSPSFSRGVEATLLNFTTPIYRRKKIASKPISPRKHNINREHMAIDDTVLRIRAQAAQAYIENCA